MSQPTWAQAFPGGVADAELQHGLTRNVSGHPVAVRLADGQVMWRGAEVLQPLLLGQGLALGLAFDLAPGTPSAPARVVALALHEAGTERWRSAPLPWPERVARGDATVASSAGSWAASWAASGAASGAVHAGWLADRILLRWSLQPLYRGGAAPGLSRAKAAAVRGSCLLDVANGALHNAPAELDSLTVAPAADEPSDDPCVTAQQLLGGVRYSLRQAPTPGAPQAPGLNTMLNTTLSTTLTAHDPVRGLDLWHCLLDEAPRKSPRALRS